MGLREAVKFIIYELLICELIDCLVKIMINNTQCTIVNPRNIY